MRLQCNGSWVTYQRLSDGLWPITVFRRLYMTRTRNAGRSASGFATGSHNCDYRLACESQLIFQLCKEDFARMIA